MSKVATTLGVNIREQDVSLMLPARVENPKLIIMPNVVRRRNVSKDKTVTEKMIVPCNGEFQIHPYPVTYKQEIVINKYKFKVDVQKRITK